MGVWDLYYSRLSVRGATKRDVVLRREQDYLRRKLPSHLSYHTAIVNDETRELAIINSDNLNQKTVIAMPGEKLVCGSLVECFGNKWLITELDANDEVYSKGIMLQCNHLLRWIAADGNIVERWCVVEDGTKYLTGESMSSYNENGMSLGDTRISVSFAKDKYTTQLNRDVRFLIDDPDTDFVLAYRITKPFKIGGVYNGEGAMSFVMTEVNTEDVDNLELRVADYYKHFPREPESEVEKPPIPGSTTNPSTGKKVWL